MEDLVWINNTLQTTPAVSKLAVEVAQCACMAQQYQAGGFFLLGVGAFLFGLTVFWKELKRIKEDDKNVVRSRKKE